MRAALPSIALALGQVVACGSDEHAASEPPAVPPEDAEARGNDSGADAGDGCTPRDDDPENCGVCGHSCHGTTCKNGVCAPLRIAANQDQPENLVVGASMVEWVNYAAGTLVQAAKDGSTAPVTLLEDRAFDLASDGVRLWFTNREAIVRCTLPSCTDQRSDSRYAYGFVAFDRAVFSIGAIPNDAGAPTTPAILRVDPDTLAASPLTTVAAPAYRLTARRGFVAWSEANGSTVRGCREDACVPTTFATSGSFIENVATDGERVYWMESGTDATLWACPVDGCTAPTALAMHQEFPGNLHVDGVNIYWTVPAGSTIVRCPATGCEGAPLEIAISDTQQRNVVAMAFDEDWIYWVESFAKVGSVWRAAK